MTPSFCCGFECGLAHWSVVGSATATTISPLTGLRSLLCTPTAGVGYVTVGSLASSFFNLLRFHVRFSVLPDAVTALGSAENAWFAGAYFNPADNKIYAGVTTGGLGSSGVAVTTGVVYLVDIRINTSANPFLVDVLVNGAACGQATYSSTATQLSECYVGFLHTCTANATFDDVLTSATAADWPLGDGQVLSYVPNADGTHTATVTNIVKGTSGTPVGAAITSATTDAFNWVNARPLGGGATDANRLINQQAVATQYVEVDFEPSVEVTAPRAVQVITADRQAATTTGHCQIKLNDNGTEDIVVTRTTGVTTDRFASKQYATMVGGGAWTLARFNALKARFGYSTDATPDQYWRGIMIEAEFAPAIGTPGAATGVAGTGTVGTPGVAKQLALSGTAAASAVGTVGITKGATLALTGATATGSVGTLAANQEQILRPISDIAANGWQPNVGLTLYDTLNEVSPDDGDYAFSPSNPTTQYAEVLLGPGANPISGARTLTTRLSAIGANTHFVLEMMQGGSLVQTFTHDVAVGDGVVQFDDTLTGTVTNYADVRFRITASA